MKKLMIASFAVAGLVACADIESANTVGYNTGTTGADNNFITVPFSAVGYNTSDIQQIKISDGGVGGIGWGTETFAIWEGVPTVREGSYFLYNDPLMDPEGTATDYYWGDDSYNKVSFSVAAGQGVVVNLAEGLTVQTAGEVPVGDVTFTSSADNNFTGNPFPAAIDIQDISISDGGVGGIGWGTETFAIWEGVPTVREGSYFLYNDPLMDPESTATDYYWGDDSYNKVNYAIPAGQGVVINCSAGLEITIKAPYSL